MKAPVPKVFSPALEAVRALWAEGPAIVAIDGRCGSGKTALAAAIAEETGCAVVHTDDCYLPFARRVPGWESVPCANMDLARLREEVLLPVSEGREAIYRPYRCREDVFGPAMVLPPGKPLLVEGSYSHHPSLAPFYALKIFLTCSADEQARRLQAREGDRYPVFARTWIPLEEAYFRRYDIGRDALWVDTTAL